MDASKSVQICVISSPYFSSGKLIFVTVTDTKLHMPPEWFQMGTKNSQYRKRTNEALAKRSVFRKKIFLSRLITNEFFNIWSFEKIYAYMLSSFHLYNYKCTPYLNLYTSAYIWIEFWHMTCTKFI